MMVAMGVFSVLMVLILGSVFSVSHANFKAQTVKTIVNNLNFSLDMMSRSIRTGIDYHCGTTGNLAIPQDCPSGASYLAFTLGDGRAAAYCYYEDPDPANFRVKQLRRQIASDPSGLSTDCAAAVFLPLTTHEITLTDLRFFVVGTTPSDTIQPKVTVVMRGYMPVQGDERSSFNLQTSITQRIYDI